MGSRRSWEEVHGLRRALDAAESVWAAQIERVDETNRASAVNLAHYWALRQYDLRHLQQRLAMLGLSSLGRSELHVQASLDVIDVIDASASALGGHTPRRGAAGKSAINFSNGPRLLRQRSVELLGPDPAGRHTRIMVTLPTEAAHDQPLVQALAGRKCRVAMDLAGPKLRTGPLADGPG